MYANYFITLFVTMNFLLRFTQSELTLIATNVIVPLLGTLLFDWSLAAILFYYWLENVVVGFYNILKMSKATGTTSTTRINGKAYSPTRNTKFSLIFFFVIHYGLFTFVHGIFVFTFFGLPVMSGASFVAGLLSLLLTHGLSYHTNFIGTGEYTKVSPPDLFIYPYPRIAVLHLVILLGAIPVLLLGAPLIALVILIVLKTFVDLKLQRFEQKKLSSLSNNTKTTPPKLILANQGAEYPQVD